MKRDQVGTGAVSGLRRTSMKCQISELSWKMKWRENGQIRGENVTQNQIFVFFKIKQCLVESRLCQAFCVFGYLCRPLFL